MTTQRDSEKVTIILHSGSYDRTSYALTMALVALATGMETHMLLTHGGLRRFTDGHLEEMGEETTAQSRKDIEFGLLEARIEAMLRRVSRSRGG